MSKPPAIHFYTGDYMKDPELSMCSPATRGIWMDFLCAAHESARSGQIAGTPDQFARVCRCTAAEFVAAVIELQTTRAADVRERNGVYTITNRRMKREADKREQERLKKQRQRKGEKIEDVPPCPEKIPPAQDVAAQEDNAATRGSPENVPLPSSSSSSASAKKTTDSDESVGGKPPPLKATNPVWHLGLQLLVAEGMDEKPARSFLGKLCRDYGDDAVAQAVTTTASKVPAEPKAYLIKLLEKGERQRGQNGSNSINPAEQEQRAAEIERLTANTRRIGGADSGKT